jgi:hypothetical protein
MEKSISHELWLAVPLLAGVLLIPFVSLGDSPPAQDSTIPTTAPSPTQESTGPEDLRSLIGVNPTGLRHVDVPQIPDMTVCGYIEQGGKAMALLEITDDKRIYLVQEGTEIPVTVAGTITPTGHGELSGLDDLSKSDNNQNPNSSPQQTQTQIILKVLKISDEGVTVTAGMERQTIIIR